MPTTCLLALALAAPAQAATDVSLYDGGLLITADDVANEFVLSMAGENVYRVEDKLADLTSSDMHCSHPDPANAKVMHCTKAPDQDALVYSLNTAGGDDKVTIGGALASSTAYGIYGMAGNDTVVGGSLYDNISGGDGNDQLTGGKGSDHMYGQNGSDTLFARDGDVDAVLDCDSGGDSPDDGANDIAYIDASRFEEAHNCKTVDRATTGGDPEPPPPPPDDDDEPPAEGCPSNLRYWIYGAYRADFAATEKELEIGLDAARAGWRVEGVVKGVGPSKKFGDLARGQLVTTGSGDDTLELKLRLRARKKLRGLGKDEAVEASARLTATAAGCDPVDGKPLEFVFIAPGEVKAVRSGAHASGHGNNTKQLCDAGADFGLMDRDHKSEFLRKCQGKSETKPPPDPPPCQPKGDAVTMGPIEAFSDCFRRYDDGTVKSETLVRLNGLELLPQRGVIQINEQEKWIDSTGPVRIFVRNIPEGYPRRGDGQFQPIALTGGGTVMEIPLASGQQLPRLELRGTKIEFPALPAGAKLPGNLAQGLAQGRAKFFGSLLFSKLKPSFDFSRKEDYGTGQASFTVGLDIPVPKTMLGVPVNTDVLPEGTERGWEATVTTTNASGVSLSLKASLTNGLTEAGAEPLGTFKVKAAEVALTDLGTNNPGLTVGGTVSLVRPGVPDTAWPEFKGSVSFKNWSFDGVSIGVDFLNRPLANGIFLQRLGLKWALANSAVTGSAGLSLGPKFELVGQALEFASVDTEITAAFLPGDNHLVPSELTFGPASLKLLMFELATAKVKLTGTSTTWRGTFAFPQDPLRGIFSFLFGGHEYQLALHGFVKHPYFQGAASSRVKIHDIVSVMQVLVNDKGFVTCVGNDDVRGGVGIRWKPFRISPMLDTCGMGPGAGIPGKARAAQAGGTTLTVEKGLRSKVFAFRGKTAAPKIALEGPGGKRVETPASATGGVYNRDFFLVQDQLSKTTTVSLGRPSAGAWKLSLLPNSSELAEIIQAKPRPEVKIEGRARLQLGGRTRFQWRAEGLDGRRIRFVERVDPKEEGAMGEEQEIRETGKDEGERSFDRLDRPGQHRIVAIVEDDGMPEQEIEVTRYRVGRQEIPQMKTCRARRSGDTVRVFWGREEDDDIDRVHTSVKANNGNPIFQSHDIDEGKATFHGFPREYDVVATCRGAADTAFAIGETRKFELPGKKPPKDPLPVNDKNVDFGFAVIE